MILNLNVMHKLYVKELSDKVKKYDIEIGKLLQEKETLLEYIKEFEISIRQNYMMSYEEILQLKTISAFNNIEKIKEVKLAEVYIKRLIKINRKIKNFQATRKYTAKQIISYKVYRAICKSFNNKVIDAIVKKNYYFKPLSTFGAIAVIRNRSERRTLNKGKSFKKKKELENKGLTPYIKADAEKAAQEGRPYEGIDWLVYNPLVNYFFFWFGNKAQALIPLINDFKFIPARSRNASLRSPVTKLQEIKDNPARAASLYTREIRK